MKKRRILIHSIFLTLIVLSLALFCYTTVREYHKAEEMDDIFGGSFTVFVCLVAFFPAFSFELELYRVVRYFALSPIKRKSRMVVNIVSLCFLPLLFFVVFILHRFMFDASIVILTSALIIAPLHFLLMRLVAFHWWSCDIENENTGGTP